MRCHELASSSLLLLLLVAAASLARVHSVKYYGDESVKNGNKFNITCELPPGSQPYWKLNGRNLLDDFAQGAMRVYQDKEVDGTIVSTLSNTVGAAERHEGSYTCAEGNETHHLIIIYEITIRVLLKSESTTLHCNAPNRTEKVEWTKDNKPLPVYDEKSGLKDLFRVISDDKLNITAPHHLTAAHFPLIYGNYTCRSGNYSADFRIVKKPIVSMTDSSNVVEGEKLHVTCGVKLSDPGVKIKWEFQGKNYTGSEGRVTLGRDEEKGLNNAIFNLQDVNMNDRGNITCHSYYLNEDKPGRISSATTYLRVKDKLAALWPFLGICAEVVILCLIILIYEKKRNKSELEESDTDQSPDTKPTPNKDSDVRHRK